MRVPAVLIILLAIAIAVVPAFTNCAAQGKSLTTTAGKQVPMKCFWTAVALVMLAVPLAATGGMLAFSRRKETRRTLAVTGGILGVLVMLAPTALIGVCASADMLCNMILLPTTVLAGALTVAVSLGTLVLTERTPEAAFA